MKKTIRAAVGSEENYLVLVSLWGQTMGGQIPVVLPNGLYRFNVKQIAAKTGMSKRAVREELTQVSLALSASRGVAQ